MYLGIDTANIRGGGGVVHLVNLLSSACPEQQGILRVIVWGGRQTLQKLPSGKPWLDLVYEPLLDKALPSRLYWQLVRLPVIAGHQCDILFCPGGVYRGNFKPVVTMSQNMLPFETGERSRYGVSLIFLRLLLLNKVQSESFINSDGVIFLTHYACSKVIKSLDDKIRKYSVIPHGIAENFFLKPRLQKPLTYYLKKSVNLLYVSIVDLYKHQWHVVEAAGILRKKGIPVILHLLGPAYPSALHRLYQAMRRFDPDNQFIYYYGQVPYSELPKFYHSADCFIFASSCENMPNILLEAMASGLPIACSRRGPMPEVLGDAGIYFDPERPDEIADAIFLLLNDPVLREQCAWSAFNRAKAYSWERCANETFSFITSVAQGSSVASLDSSMN